MTYLIYSVGRDSRTLKFEGVVYDEKSPKAALDSFYYKHVGGTRYQRKRLVAIKSFMPDVTSWTNLTIRWNRGQNIRKRRANRRRK